MPTRTVGFDKFQRKLKKMSKAVDDLDDKTVMKVAGEVRNRIIKRTLRGRDVDMKSFKAYSKLTNEYRSEKGRKTGRPNLAFSFRMLGNMSVKKYRKGAMIHFTSTAQNDKAVWHNEGVSPHKIVAKNKKVLSNGIRFFGKEVTVSLPKREFFGLSKHNHKYVLSELRQPVVKAMR